MKIEYRQGEEAVGFLCLKETGKATVELAVIWHMRCVRKSYGRAEDLFGPMQKQIQVLRKRLSAPDLSQSE